MATLKIIEGRIQDISDRVNLILFQMELPQGEFRLVAKKETLDAFLYDQLKSFQIDDFCSFEVTLEEKDPAICNLLSHIKKQGDYFWSHKTKEVARAYSFLLNSLREYLALNGYTEVRLPGIHFGRNKNETFELAFFGKTARLTSSNSLFLDIYAIQLQKAFSIQKCFRAEKVQTNRHLAEFDLLEVAGLNRSLEETMAEVEKLVKFVLDKFEKSPFASLSPINFTAVKQKTFPILPYPEIENQYHLNGQSVGKYEIEIASAGPVFVTHLPRKIASWTALPVNQKYTRTFNLLLPGVGEGVEGNQKQTDKNLFRQKLQAAGVEKQLGWYPKMIPYSNFLLTNFGLGVERLAMWLMGLEDIREVHPIYRDNDFSELKEKD
ncbi:MAG: hypothetical protein NT166_04010 [Candidatus Aminicenantes bacterium]|nr:hypothetical protein [Candidatus Aminicenantes bacterium]